MSKVLYITCNPKKVEESFSLQVGKEFLDEYKNSNPNDEIVHLDLFKEEIPFIDHDILSSWDKLRSGISFADLSDSEKSKLTKFNSYTDQFVDFDKYIFVSPFWNLSVPPLLKAYIDTVMVAGKTFAYTAEGPKGLLENKKAVHIEARGGMYSTPPISSIEMGSSYIKNILGFMGVSSIESIIVEGLSIDPTKAEEIKAEAINKALDLAKSF
ncbi:FMN-dependent NADH-azoreductase [Clostridium sp.]|uniref:FMN-dependent NADH-azoreductase n=1 Tax=Clostridium sp. TaxID=1506 RepID=UPI003464DA23